MKKQSRGFFVKKFRDLEFTSLSRDERTARLQFDNGYVITAYQNETHAGQIYDVIAGELQIVPYKPGDVPADARYAAYRNCTPDKITYLMELLQRDPEKVMSRNC